MTNIIKLDTPAYVLRTCYADMRSPAPEAKGFTWPEAGYVEAPDFADNLQCGYGLHGALWGAGNSGLFCWDADAKWLVVEVDHYIELSGKVKFRDGNVVFCGDKAGATAFLHAKSNAAPIIGLTLTGGNRSTLTGGYGSFLTFKFWDSEAQRYRRKMFEVDNLEVMADKPYRLSDGGILVPAE